MNIRTSCLILKTDRPIIEPANKLRGFISNKFSEYPIFHHHLNDDKYLYTYPRIQYKIIEGDAYILGMEEGVNALKKIIDIDIEKLPLGTNIYNIERRIWYENNEKFIPVREFLQYKFLTPWLALNKDNYQKFRILEDWKEKKVMLNNILVANIISMCKGLSYDIEPNIYAHSKIKEIKVEFKGMIVNGFIGEFRTNFKIPDLFGLGKGVSHGFGVVKSEKIDIIDKII